MSKEDLMGIFDNDNIEIVDPLEYVMPENYADHTEEDEPDEIVPEENIENTGEDESNDFPEEVTSEDDQEGVESNDSPDGEPIELYSSFASVLSESGLLPSIDLEKTEIKSVDDLSNAFKTEIESQVSNYLREKIGDDGVEALEKGITLAEYQSYNTAINALDTITDDRLESDLELAKRIIHQDYTNQGLSEDKSNRFLRRIIDSGEDAIIEESKDALRSLKEFETRQLDKVAEARKEQANQSRLNQEKLDNDLKSAVFQSDEYIKGMGKVPKTLKDKVYSSITKVVGTSPNGIAENTLMKHRREDPIDFDVKLYYLYELTKGFTDFSKLVSRSESVATRNLESSLRTTRFESSSEPTYMQDNQSYKGFGDELVM